MPYFIFRNTHYYFLSLPAIRIFFIFYHREHGEHREKIRFLPTACPPVPGIGRRVEMTHPPSSTFRHSGESRNPVNSMRSGCRIKSGMMISRLFTTPSSLAYFLFIKSFKQ